MRRLAPVVCALLTAVGCGGSDGGAPSGGDPDGAAHDGVVDGAGDGAARDAAGDGAVGADVGGDGALDAIDGSRSGCRTPGGGSLVPFPGPTQCPLTPAAGGVVRYVDAASGVDAGNDGTGPSKPLKTIGRALALGKPGDVLLLQDGTYRERVDYGGVGGTKDAPLTLRAAPGAKPVVAGSAVVTGFAPTADAAVFSLAYSDTALLDGEPVGVPQQVFVDGAPLRQIGPSVAHPACTPSSGAGPCIEAFGTGHADVVATAGSFYFDPSTHALEVHLDGGADPGAHTIEVSVRRRVLWLGLASQYVCVEGLTFHHSNASGLHVEQEAGVFIGAHSTLANSVVERMDFAGVSLGYDDDDARALYVIARKNGNVGITAAGTTHALVEHCQVRDNNQRHFNVLWNAGGLKMASGKTTATIRDSVFDHNYGPGVWCDFCGGGDWRIERNLFIGNTREAQIFDEVSPGATIVNNLLIGDAADPDTRAIFIRESSNATVKFNTIVRKTPSIAIDVFGGPRGDASGATLLGNVVVSLAASGSSTELRFGSATGPGGLTGTQSSGNLFFAATGKYQFVYGAVSATLAAWQKAGFDADSLVADPGFVGGDDYSLGKGSPAIDRLTQALVKDDHDGTARPKGPKSDVGAFERCVE